MWACAYLVTIPCLPPICCCLCRALAHPSPIWYQNEDGTYVSKGIPKDFVYIKKEVDTGCDYKVVKEKYPDVTKAEAKVGATM